MGKVPARPERSHDHCRSAGRRDQAGAHRRDLALGVRLRAYRFDRYKTKRKEDEERPPRR